MNWKDEMRRIIKEMGKNRTTGNQKQKTKRRTNTARNKNNALQGQPYWSPFLEFFKLGEKAKGPFVLAFILPMLVMVIGYAINDVYPFGEQSILCSDLYNQYLPFFADLRDSLKNGGSLLFSWNLGLGSNFLSLYAYYLASPLNWLLVFVPAKYLIEFMGCLIVFKIGLCGLSFSYYLYKHFGKRDYSITVFALFYALSGFIGAYNWDIMWLDVIALVPLVMLGLEMLVKEKKPFLYGITLALSILFNYYIAMIMCIFLVLYFTAQVILLPKEKWNAKHIFSVIGLFALFSILAAGMASVLLLPVAKALSSTKYASATFPEEWKVYFSPLLAFARHFMNVDTEIGHDHWPNLYCGVGVFFLLPLWFTCKKVSIKEKIVYACMLVIFLLSFSINRLDFIWHGMNFPNCLPARQTFLYDFIMVTICYKTFLESRKDHFWKYCLAFVVAAVSYVLIVTYADVEEYPDHSYLYTGIFLGVEIIIFWIYQKGKCRAFLAVLGSLVILAEVTINMSYAGILTSKRANYIKNDESYRTLIQLANEREENDFFRMEIRDRKTKNDAMYYGFHSATMFSSTTGEQLQKFYRELGLSSSKVFYWDGTGSPLINDILGIRYLFAERDDLSNPFYQLIRTEGNISLYEYTHQLPLGFVIDENLEDWWDYSEGDQIQAQNSLVYELGCQEPLFAYIDGMDNEEGDSYFEVTTDGYYYVYVGNLNVDEIKYISTDIDGVENSKTFKQVQNDYLLDCGWCEEGTELHFISEEEGEEEANMEMEIYRVNEYAMDYVHSQLSNQTMQVERYTDTKLIGTIQMSERGKLVTSVPFEQGFTLYVDGVETEIELFADTMIAVTLPEGEHTIKLVFYPEGLREGMVVFAASWFVFILIFFKVNKEEREKLFQMFKKSKKNR